MNSANSHIAEDCLLVCWQIWKARNNLIFSDLSTPFQATIQHAASIGSTYWNANKRTPSLAPANHNIIKWIPPTANWHKLNFDGAVSSTSAAVDFVIRSSSSQPLISGSRNWVPVAKSFALKDGLLAALDLNIQSLKIEGDSALIISCSQNVSPSPWSIKYIIRDIEDCIGRFK
ncbi:uncharacterized protein LOC126796805 [Argentina anserina]|uniref:uncharacterized protein LOC126796805 n=1 Tax=Argentina anserina TaxID=57926 RepID=UPI002176375E|nr:uncharacterized protein LOC126796805 [Potentilla anserina]